MPEGFRPPQGLKLSETITRAGADSLRNQAVTLTKNRPTTRPGQKVLKGYYVNSPTRSTAERTRWRSGRPTHIDSHKAKNNGNHIVTTGGIRSPFRKIPAT